MAGFLRLLAGLALVPFCWGLVVVFSDSLQLSVGSSDWMSAEVLSLLGGMVVFAVVWLVLPHPVRTYVLGHELTHALWGVMFGARPSRVRVSASGGSVRLTKSNVLITLAPYFFPFYTFVVIVLALVTAVFVRPLPCLPLWLFGVGVTWAFHILFTLETLFQRQPDVTLYGRVFSWVFIFIANLTVVLLWLAVMTPLGLSSLFRLVGSRAGAVYSSLGRVFVAFFHEVF